MIKIYGKNCIREALLAKAPLQKIFLCKEFADMKVLKLLQDCSYNLVDKCELDRLFGSGHQGIGAYREDYPIYGSEIIGELKSRVLILDGITDPHNLGAIIRSVDAFGFEAIILPKNRSCSVNETVAHVSTGAIEYVKIAYVNSLLSTVKSLKEFGFWLCGTDACGNTPLSDVDLDRKLAIIIGSEGFGMSKTLLNQSDYIVNIAMVGHVNSLNASVSAGIVLYCLKQKNR